VTQKLTSNFFAGLLILIASVPAAAQTLDGPTGVCAGQGFQVNWTGPGGNGDRIVVTVPQYPADEASDWRPTSDGNPVTLGAPTSPGTYELRYVQDEPLSILAREDLLVSDCDQEGYPNLGDDGYPQVAVEVRGFQVDHGDEINPDGESPYGPVGYTIDDFCAAAPQIGQAMRMIVYEIESAMAQGGVPVSLDMIELVPGAPSIEDIAEDVRNAREAICDQPPPSTTIQPFVITYAYCRMAMQTPTHAMDIHIPVGSDASMSMADHQKDEVVTVSMQRSLQALSTQIGQGWGSNIQMTGPGAASTHIGYPTQEYSFEYTAGLGGAPSLLSGIADTIKVKNKGSGWFATEVPGIDVIRLFYERMSTEAVPDGGAASFFGSLINNMVGMLQYGVPIVMDQTTSSSVMGATMVKGRTEHYVTSMSLVDFESGWCDQTLMPAAYTVTDVDEQIAEAMGSSGVDSDQMSESTQQYNEAMQNITPEQRAMMESMGMGDMMQQAMGAAGGAAMPSGASAGSNVQLSAALTTSNQTQSVQLHLNALGYGVGNTNGDESLHTSIAISQYQAERGLDVTGEVSQQLLDALSAEINRGQ
jgi:hypothetical protein